MRRESSLMASDASEPKPVSEVTLDGRDEVSRGKVDGMSGAEEQFLAALRLFEAGQVTTAKAAEMCGMPSVDFLLAAERSNQPRQAARL